MLKRLSLICAAVLMLCCASWGYVLNPPDIKFDAMVNTSSGSLSNTITYSHTVGASGGYLLVCVTGVSAVTTETVTAATYNGNPLTWLATENVRGTPTNPAPITWLYGMSNPPSGSHNVIFTTSVNGFHITSTSYLNVGDVVGVAATLSNTSPVNNAIGTSRAGSWLYGCSGQHDGASGDTNTYLRNSGHPFTYDSNGPYTNVSGDPFIKFTFDTMFAAAPYITAEIRPPKPIRVVTLGKSWINSNNWTVNGSDWFLTSCDFITSVWDTTTTPWTNITGSATVSCTGSGSFPIAIGFSGNKTGVAVLRPNPTSSLR